MLVLIELKTS